MTATEIQALEAAREDAISKIITTRLSNAYDCEKLAFNNVDVTLTKDGTDVTKDYNLNLTYLDEENVLSIMCTSQERKDSYESIYFYIKGDDAISITKGNEYRSCRLHKANRDSEEDQEFCLTIKVV